MASQRARSPSPKRASKMSRNAREAEILSVARDRFCQHGFGAASVAEIASHSGVSEATVFKYFPTKRDLLNKVIEHWYGELFGDYSKELSVIDGARNRFRFLAWKHLCTIRDEPAMCRLIFNEVRVQPSYKRSPAHRMNLRYTGMLTEVIEEGCAQGEFRSDLPVDLLRDLVYGGAEHHAWRYLYSGGRLDVEKVADQLVEILCAGISQAAHAGSQDDLPALVERLEVVASSLVSKRRKKA